MRTLVTLVGTVTGSMLVAVAGLWITRQLIPPEVLRANNEVCGNYLQTVGTIYAVLLAFVVFEVWTQQNEAWRFIEQQADELTDVVRIAGSLGEPARSAIRAVARDYLREVIEQEWLLMARGQASARATQLVDQLWRALAVIEPQTPREQTLYAEAVSRFNDFGDARTDLLQNSRMHLPTTLWLLLITGALSNVGSMYLFGLDEFWCLALMTASLAGAISFVLFLIYDLDNSFSGDWQVRPDPLQQALARIETADD